jgi:hypothetical protein
MAIYINQIAAMEKVLRGFGKEQYGVLAAQMQSGKSTTFRLIACEMMRRGKVDRVVIFSGTSDTDLRTQTDLRATAKSPENKKTKKEFQSAYRKYLREYQGVPDGEELMEYVGLIDDIDVCWAPEFASFVPSPRTLYIWEESHYGQSKGQRVDKFLSKIGVKGEEVTPGCFVLSVSATPFSELAVKYHKKQTKIVTTLEPGKGYIGVEFLYANRLKSFGGHLPSLAKYTSGYVVIRAIAKKATSIEETVRELGFDVIKFDMSYKGNLNDKLIDMPARKTVVLVKGKLRMGKVLCKDHIRCVIETSSSSKTDTLLQGLLGRCCGYYTNPIDIFVENLDAEEIESYIELFKGKLTSIPKSGMNMGKALKVRKPCIPILIEQSKEFARRGLWGEICPEVVVGSPGSVSEIEFHEDNADPFWNDNPREYVEEMRRVIKQICMDCVNPLKKTHARKHFRVHGNKKDSKPEGWDETLQRVEAAYAAQEHKCGFAGAGAGASATIDEVVVWYDGSRLYISMQVEIPDEGGVSGVAETTGREVYGQ